MGWDLGIFFLQNLRKILYYQRENDRNGSFRIWLSNRKDKFNKFILTKGILKNNQSTFRIHSSRRLVELFATNSEAFVNIMML